ncbi:hypothetical protein [Actinoplanes philippinensis]|uniref:hypothetical protein n=1 Tax=Actinoplanes philippinensis TaxID=35752 RepID=UPI00340A54DB
MLSTGVDMYSGRREVRAGGEIFSVRAFDEVVALDASYRVLRADARQGSGRGREVRLARLDVFRGGVCADRRRAELKAEARLHGEVAGLPRVVFRFEERDTFTFVTAVPPGVALTELYGRPPLPGRALVAVLRGFALVGRTLEGLHRTGRAHRALRPEVLFASRDRMWLRDAGLAAAPPEAGEGVDAYRAPEQRRAAAGPATGVHQVAGPAIGVHQVAGPAIGVHQVAGPAIGVHQAAGPAIDVHQLAAIAYHLVTGEAPGADPLPVTLLRPEWGRLDEILAAALHPDPRRRPALGDLTAALGRAA